MAKMQLALDGRAAPESNSVQGVDQKSESEPIVEDGLARTMEFAGKIRANWEVREARDGKTQWFCPMEPDAKRQYFDTKKECQEYMGKNFTARVEQAKLEKKPKSTYTPQKIRVSPKREMSDYVPPEYAHLAVVSRATRDRIQSLGKMARNLSGNAMTAGVLVGMTESQAIARVKGLDDHELKRTAVLAYNRSRRRLFKTAKAECDRRGIKVVV